MKVTRYNRGYAVRLTETEMGILRLMDALVDHKALWSRLSASERKSLSRRTHNGFLLRTDSDKRHNL